MLIHAGYGIRGCAPRHMTFICSFGRWTVTELSFFVPLPYTLIILILAETCAAPNSTDSEQKNNGKVNAKRIFLGTAKKEAQILIDN